MNGLVILGHYVLEALDLGWIVFMQNERAGPKEYLVVDLGCMFT